MPAAINDLDTLPPDLPAPQDDGAADHLARRLLPSLALPASGGGTIDLSALHGRTVVYLYPRTGQPGMPPLVEHWNAIPGARGCTPQSKGYRDAYADFAAMGVAVFGLSTQTPDYQRETAERLGLPFSLLSDAHYRLADALAIPTFEAAGQRLFRRMAWVVDDGRIVKVFYPVFPPDGSAAVVLRWLRDRSHT